MSWHDKGSTFWRLVVALVAAAIIFAAPASHASTSPCSAPKVAADAYHQEHGDRQAAGKMSPDKKSCCSATCAACVTAIMELHPQMPPYFPAHPIIEWSFYPLGREPAPGFEPPRSAA